MLDETVNTNCVGGITSDVLGDMSTDYQHPRHLFSQTVLMIL